MHLRFVPLEEDTLFRENLNVVRFEHDWRDVGMLDQAIGSKTGGAVPGDNHVIWKELTWSFLTGDGMKKKMGSFHGKVKSNMDSRMVRFAKLQP